MGYNIKFKGSVSRDLKNIGKDQADRILKNIEKDLPEKADSQPVLTGRFAGLRKYRVGDYRIIFTIIQNDVLILRISHRKESYRK